MAIAPIPRFAEIMFATVALLFLAPLVVVLVLTARLLFRDHAALQGFLHKSRLADVPLLFDVIAVVPVALPAIVTPEVTPYQIVGTTSDLDILGRTFRARFRAVASAEFDGLLRAIDRAQQSLTPAR